MNENITHTNYYRTFAKINLDAIEHNFNELKKKVHTDVKICAVIKADAYGHGAIQTAHLLSGKTDFFAVASIDEALELRQADITNPILILSYSDPLQYEQLIEHELIPTIYSLEEAKKLSALAVKLGKKAVVHLAVDTGMSRIGLTCDESGADTAKSIALLPELEIQGLFSHYAKADYEDKSFCDVQTKRFDSFIAMLEERDVFIPIKHICNSAGIMELDKHYDMVRMGISLYGLYPSDEVKKETARLIPAMEVISHVIHIHEVESGTGIGYGHAYIANEKRKIATVSIGYADGYNRCLTNKGYVLIHGKKAPITGKVCMDQTMVDITDIPDVHIGDQAVIMGKSENSEISAEALGKLCYSFNYEVVCTFMPRVKRLYFRGGKMIS